MKTILTKLFYAFISVCLMIVLTGVKPAHADAVNLTVTKTEDTSDGVCDADCSLREAITVANNNGLSEDIITLPAGTYTLTLAGAGEDANASGDLDITSSLTINGAGTDSTIIQAGATPGSGIDRVLHVLGTGTVVSISDITIANGRCTITGTLCEGGGIRHGSQLTLTLTNITFTGNSATWGGGLYSCGTSNITNSMFSGNSVSNNGGGILHDCGSTMNVTNSIFSDNSANIHGGGIYNNFASPITVTNSTFSNNFANNGGGIYNFSFLDSVPVTVTNSTFSGNDAQSDGGGIYNSHGITTLTNNTFSGNSANSGGGVFNNSTGILHLKNTILANSTSDSDCYNNGGTIATDINNLIEINGLSENMCGTPTVTSDPNLGSMTGSPAYFPLNSGSPAIDAGDDAVCAADPVNNTSQNGVTRPSGAHCDMGSVEAIATYVITLKSVNTNDGWILESTETSGNGGTLDSTAINFSLGDDAANKQYRAILHFDTSGLPDNAVVTSATLKIKQQGVVGTDPFTLLGDLKASVRTPAFGTDTLALSDFKSAPGKNNVATFSNTPVSDWYSALVNNTGRVYISRTGTTQFRLTFTTDDNNDNGADLMKFYSGDAATANRPQLVIQYYIP